MSIDRRKIKGRHGGFLTKPTCCYICNRKKAFHTLHGEILKRHTDYSGKACCNDCYPIVKDEIIEKTPSFQYQ